MFQGLKDQIAQNVTLMMPEDKALFVLECDASDCAVRSTLSQEIDGELQPVAFMFHSLTKPKKL